MRGFVCYLERAGAGAAIRRVRLVGPEVDRTWTAPNLDQEAPAGDSGGGPDLVANTRAAASWVAAELEGEHRLVAVCIDIDGGVCAWLSAPSADTAVIAAAVQQSHHGAGVNAGGEMGASTSGLGLSPDPSAAFGSGRSLQALAAPGVGAPPRADLLARFSRGRGAGNGKGKGASGASRHRLAVLSVPDAAVRVFLDELDEHRIEVGSVLSIWHALAAAWNPPAAPDTGPDDPRIVADSGSPLSAVVMTDPLGRLVWAWSHEGMLVAAGSIRLRVLPAQRAVETSAPPLMETEPPDGGVLAVQGVKRIAVPEPGADGAPDGPALECAEADIGRLVMDWLAWSAQLGQTPERIVCIGPATVSSWTRPDPMRGTGAPPAQRVPVVSVPEAVARAWPGALIDAAMHDDPVGATLDRLRGPAGRVNGRAGASTRSEAALVAPEDDARAGLVQLTHRPGRVEKRFYRWIALAIVAAAFGTVVIGWRLNALAADSRERAGGVEVQKRALLADIEPVLPGVSMRTFPLGELSAKLVQMKDQRSRLTRSRPVLAETMRVLGAMKDLSDLQISEISINSIFGSVKVNFPSEDTETGPLFLDLVRSVPGVMAWSGTDGLRHDKRRDYNLTGTYPAQPGEPPGGAGGGS